ncbi:superoxide dismutase [[Actinobacillus] rossii]|uniref:Superoxide dismutase n=1 Tax=[Actinobacillus] rossii TaxID=123820 RepID=A0A380TQU0_9PAST|nr:superoxide dismutase [[Actinobacillus] rossii]
MKKALLALALVAATGTAVAQMDKPNTAESLKISVQLLDPVKGNQDVGFVSVTESKYGLVFTPELKGLTAGVHGFHIHENPSCDAKEKDGKLTAGLAAGGH